MSRLFVKSTRGFTLVEMLIYMGIVVTVSTASVLFLISLDNLIDQYQMDTALYRSSSNVLERVVLSIRQADQFDVLDSVLDDNVAGALAVIEGANETRFVKSGAAFHLFVNGEDQGDMTSSIVTVTGFTVRRYDTAIGQFIRVELTLSAAVDDASRTMTFYSGGVIRGAL